MCTTDGPSGSAPAFSRVFVVDAEYRILAHDLSYPPLNQPKEVADCVWIVDSAPIHAGGIPLPLRMTVLRLTGGELLLHSPVPYHPGLQRAVETLGRIGHLVAPSIGHWLFLKDWQAACPNAITWAVSGLEDRSQVRRSGLAIDAELSDRPPRVWANEIDQVLVAGPVFKEICLFHRPSRTLLLTDLIINLEGDLLPVFARPLARLLGIVAPEGRAPLYLRLLLRLNHRDTVRAAQRLVAFNPERVIFAHGQWFDRDAAGELRRSLAWILDGQSASRQLSAASATTTRAPLRSTALAGLALVGVWGLFAYLRRSRR